MKTTTACEGCNTEVQELPIVRRVEVSVILPWWGVIRKNYGNQSPFSSFLDMAYYSILNNLFETEDY